MGVREPREERLHALHFHSIGYPKIIIVHWQIDYNICAMGPNDFGGVCQGRHTLTTGGIHGAKGARFWISLNQKSLVKCLAKLGAKRKWRSLKYTVAWPLH